MTTWSRGKEVLIVIVISRF